MDRIEPTRRRDRLDAVPRMIPGERPKRGRPRDDDRPDEDDRPERDEPQDPPPDDDGRPHVDIRA